MPDPPRILLMIHDDYPAGGVQRSAMNIRAALCEAGLEVEILCLKRTGAEGLASQYPYVRPVSPQHASRLAFWLNFLWSLRGLLKREPRAVLIGLGLTPSLSLALCSWGITTIGIVGSERAHPPLMEISPLLRLARRLLFRRLDRIVVQSSRSVQWYQENLKLPGRRVVVIPNVVPAPITSSNQSRKSDHPTLLCVGRLDHQKGFDWGLEIFARVQKEIPSCRLKIFGEGPDKEYLEKIAQALGIRESVEFLYVGNDLSEVWPLADVFLFPSRYEGFPNALAEAMANGLACVAFNCLTGPGELIRQGETGYLVELGEVAEAASKTVHLLTHPAERQEMGRKARQVTQRYSSQSIGKLWANLIRQVKD